MQRNPPGTSATGPLVGPTEGVTKAANEAAGAVEATAAALGVVEGVLVAVALGVVEGVLVALAPAAAALGVVEGVSVPVGVALAAGAALALAAGAALALTPGRLSVASQAPPHRTYCAGQAVLPLCWQHVSMGSAADAGLKCMRYVERESYMPPTGDQGGKSQHEVPGAIT
jgi:hypothetical protein